MMGYQYLFPAQELDVKCYWMLMYIWDTTASFQHKNEMLNVIGC